MSEIILSKRVDEECLINTVIRWGDRFEELVESVVYARVSNKYTHIESKIKIYKTSARPIKAYAPETRFDMKATKNKFWTTEMRVLRNALNVKLYDCIRNDEISHRCKVQTWRGKLACGKYGVTPYPESPGRRNKKRPDYQSKD